MEKVKLVISRADSTVASDTRGPGFEFGRRQLLLNMKLFVDTRKTKEKEADISQLK